MKERKTGNLDRAKAIGGVILFTLLSIKACETSINDYQQQQKELDALCGKDRSGCNQERETFCFPHFDGTVGCIDRINYTPKSNRDE